MYREFNEKLIKCLIETTIFLEFSDESVVNTNSSIEVMEIISSELHGLNPHDVRHFIEQIGKIALSYSGDKKEFLMGLRKRLGVMGA
jgi:hypothetical protein